MVSFITVFGWCTTWWITFNYSLKFVYSPVLVGLPSPIVSTKSIHCHLKKPVFLERTPLHLPDLMLTFKNTRKVCQFLGKLTGETVYSVSDIVTNNWIILPETGLGCTIGSVSKSSFSITTGIKQYIITFRLSVFCLCLDLPSLWGECFQ